MPELPEVETVLRTLETLIKDRTICDVHVFYEPIVGDTATFKDSLIGQRFCEFKRRGKYLLFEMSDLTLVSHLRMEGKYYVLDKNEEIDKHTHVVFDLDDGKQLRYRDVRKFGRMEIIDKGQTYDDFKKLGPEPFSDSFNLEYIRSYLNNKHKAIKEVLLDQSFVAGIGNIYADEILWAIKVHPEKEACALSDKEISEMIVKTRTILSEAIKAGGTTIRSYTSSLGVTGRFQLSLNCHTRKECPDCKTAIIKTRVGGRGTYFCPLCQKK